MHHFEVGVALSSFMTFGRDGDIRYTGNCDIPAKRDRV